jgi:NAD(P)-dependent dehydrogenase (short-subunit alcohol dehydrogenase family)
MKIKDKRIVVTGAASGIGLALCEEFHASGVKSIVCVDINEEGAKNIAEKVNGIAIAADVSDEKDIINVVEKANKYSGGIDIFCSNAGVGGTPMLLETTSEEWNSTWSINVMSHVHAARHVLPQMLERGEGYLMNTASAAGLLSQIGAAQYAVTKSAAISFAEWIKITYGQKGIGVSCLCPQAVRTAMTAQGAGVAGVDGMLEPDVVAKDVLDAIEKERFLVLPHKEVAEYVQRKGNDRDRWITGMQRLQKQYEDFYENWVSGNKGENNEN